MAIIQHIEREHGSLSQVPEDDFYYRLLQKELTGTEAYDYEKSVPVSYKTKRNITLLSKEIGRSLNLTILRLIDDYIESPFELSEQEASCQSRVKVKISKEMTAFLEDKAKKKDINFNVLSRKILNVQSHMIEQKGVEEMAKKIEKR